MNLSEVVHWTTLLSSAAAACWLSQLVWFGLWRKYIWLFGFFLTDILETLFLSGLSTRSHGYGDIYVVGQTVKAILAIASSIQLWLLVLAVYPGLARFGRRIMIYLMGIAVPVGAAGYALQPPRSGALSSFLHHFNAVEGSVASMLAGLSGGRNAIPVVVSRGGAAQPSDSYRWFCVSLPSTMGDFTAIESASRGHRRPQPRHH